VATWSKADRCDSRAVLAAIGALLPPPPAGSGGPFALSEPGRLEDLLAGAGLTPKCAEETAVPFVFPDVDTAVRAHLSAGPARRAIQVAGRDSVATALRTALEPSIQADGTSRHDNAFRFVVATA